ncbi:MAG: hypothetical protein IPG68_05810 [Micrococcales bacterium]|nr:hypothetical protein [Micrococcales bacterium]
MDISPQIIVFVLFMLAVVQGTRIDEMRQRKRELLRHSHARPQATPRSM